MAKLQCAQLCKERYLLDCEADWPRHIFRVNRVQWSKYLNPPKNRRVDVSTFNADVRLNVGNQIVNKTINSRRVADKSKISSRKSQFELALPRGIEPLFQP
jgi:hypothetical protein